VKGKSQWKKRRKGDRKSSRDPETPEKGGAQRQRGTLHETGGCGKWRKDGNLGPKNPDTVEKGRASRLRGGKCGSEGGCEGVVGGRLGTNKN